jgi:hypothetical protein
MLSFRAKYEIIFPLPSSPQKAPTITEQGIKLSPCYVSSRII